MQFFTSTKNRREFLSIATLGTASIITSSNLSIAQSRKDRGSRLKTELVHEFVKVAHRDLEKVKELLNEQPALLNAAWDWGGGDWETAIGAAGHMGRRDIALYLLEHGARMDIFVAAMLGKIDIVKTTLDVFPNLVHSKGPHGIPLLAHAKAGGEEAKVVLEYLQRVASSN